jgi:hypothetical protein
MLKRDFWDIPTIKRKLRQIQTSLNTSLIAYYTQTQVDNLLTGKIDQAALDAALTAYYTQAQVDALIDAHQQALIDCGCIEAPCTSFQEDYSQGIGDASINGDWFLDWNFNQEKLRIQRIDGADDQFVYISVPINMPYRDGLTLEFEFKNETYVDQTRVYVVTQIATEEYPPVTTMRYTGTGDGAIHTQSLNIDDTGSEGDNIIEIQFEIRATDQSTTFSRWTLHYLRILCP